MNSPRYSLRQLIYLTTMVAALSTALVFVGQLPGNCQEVIVILLAMSGFLLLGAGVAALYLHPFGKLLVNLIVALVLVAESIGKYLDIRDSNASFASWDGLVMALLLASSAAVFWQGVEQFRSVRKQISGK